MKTEPRDSTQYLSEPASILLDVVRFSAAILVLIAHFTHPEFRLAYPNLQILGDIAVPVFFVLSGFVIRYVTKTRESTAKEYFIDRASRIYSVVLPAMFFTLVVSAVCFAVDRPQFLRDWSGTFNHPLTRLMFNLVFISQAWGHNTVPFINSPFWSLGYECAYYLFYGLIFFLRGWQRILLCALVALAVGPQVILLFPVWWLGCWVYDLYVRCRSGVGAVLLLVSAGWLVGGAGLFVSGFRAFLLWPVKIFVGIAGLRNPIEWLGMPPVRASMFAVGRRESSPLLDCLFFFWRRITLRSPGRIHGQEAFGILLMALLLFT
jgi:peptidoglycan/LPS O-acetylase OafA/YrhL